MTPDTQAIQEQLLTKKVARLDARVYEIDSLMVPLGTTLEGVGQGLTELRFVGQGTALTIIRDTPAAANTLRGFTLTATTPQAAGIHVYSPTLFQGNRGHASELTIEHVEVRPMPGVEWHASFKRGIVVQGIAGARIRDVFIAGRFQDHTLAALAEPDAMDIAFDLQGSQEAKLSECYVHGAKKGVYCNVPVAGAGEGHSITQSAIINVLQAIHMEGQPAGIYGGFNTPWLSVTENHLFYLQHGILASNYSDLHISGNSCCVSQFNDPTQWKVGVYLVKCSNARISDNNFWSTKPGMAMGVLGDRTINSTMHGNTLDPSMTTGTLLTVGSTGWTDTNAWITPTKILNYGTANAVSS